MICRFLLGIICAQYMALAPNLIKDHFPDRLWKPYGAVYSAMRIIGMLFCYFIGEIFINNSDSARSIALFLGPVVISIIQAVALYFILPESPV